MGLISGANLVRNTTVKMPRRKPVNKGKLLTLTAILHKLLEMGRLFVLLSAVIILVACTTVFVDDGANSVVVVHEHTTIDPVITEPIK
jgi:hypothetical protein